MSLTPDQRSLRARLGGLARAAQHDTRALALPGLRAMQAGRWRRYLDQVDPKRELTEEERDRRARAARKAEMTRLSLRSSVTRQGKKKSGSGVASAAAQEIGGASANLTAA